MPVAPVGPRGLRNVARRVVDFALVGGDGNATDSLADHALTRLEVDELGLDGADRRYLRMIAGALFWRSGRY